MNYLYNSKLFCFNKSKIFASLQAECHAFLVLISKLLELLQVSKDSVFLITTEFSFQQFGHACNLKDDLSKLCERAVEIISRCWRRVDARKSYFHQICVSGLSWIFFQVMWMGWGILKLLLSPVSHLPKNAFITQLWDFPY